MSKPNHEGRAIVYTMKKELINLANDLCRRANILDGLNPHTSKDPTAPNYAPRDHERAQELRDIARELRRIASAGD